MDLVSIVEEGGRMVGNALWRVYNFLDLCLNQYMSKMYVILADLQVHYT